MHNVGDIKLKTNQTLFIDEGAVVYANVSAIDADNIKILGRGILDNSKNVEEIFYECNEENNLFAVNNAKRKHTVQLEYCTNVEIDGITIRDSLVYNIRPLGCGNIHISNVKIIGCWRYNSDGIDMHNCEDVLIENCFLRTFDDSICVKGFDCYYDGDIKEAVDKAMNHNGKTYDVFKNTVVRNCVIWNDWGKCLEIGAETKASEIHNIVFENCDIIHISGRPLDCCNNDYAEVHDIIYRNINIECDYPVPMPILQKTDNDIYPSDRFYLPAIICVEVSYNAEYSLENDNRGINRNILFENIYFFGNQIPKIRVVGYDNNYKSKDITIKNIFVNGKLLNEISENNLLLNEYVENVIYVSDN